MKLLLTTIAAVVLVGCSDPEAEANKLFTEASQLVKEADAITEPYSLKAYNKSKAAVELLEKIPVQYPQSSLSVRISEGDFKIQGQSIDNIKANIERSEKKIMAIYFDAAMDGNIEAVKQHLAAGADVNAKDKDGGTPLHYAALEGHMEVAELLIDKGADVNAKDSYNRTPLLIATSDNHKDIAELLIAKGSDVNAKMKYGGTPLHHAATKEIVELLIAAGADVNAIEKSGGLSSEGGTRLDYAILGFAGEEDKEDKKAIIELLLKHGGKMSEGVRHSFDFDEQEWVEEIKEILKGN